MTTDSPRARTEDREVWRVECGCGFSATGDDGLELRYMLEGHLCSAVPEPSFGVALVRAVSAIMALAVFAYVLVAIFGGGS